MNRTIEILTIFCGYIFFFFIFHDMAQINIEKSIVFAVLSHYLVTRNMKFADQKNFNAVGWSWKFILNLSFLILLYGGTIFALWLLKAKF